MYMYHDYYYYFTIIGLIRIIINDGGIMIAVFAVIASTSVIQVREET